MKTLSQLQNEAIERFEKLKNGEMTRVECEGVGDNNGFYEIKKKQVTWDDVENFLKTELEKIVKESFKNTRVEEAVVSVTSLGMIPINAGGALQVASNFGRNQALSDKHNKECEFLGN